MPSTLAWEQPALHSSRLEVHQKLMRHSDIRTTMNIYGDAASADMRKTHGKIVRRSKLRKNWLLR